MKVTLEARLPSSDPLLALLHSQAPASAKLFPGGHFGSPESVRRRLAYLDGPYLNASSGVSSSSSSHVSALSPASRLSLLRSENAFAPLHAAQAANLEAAGKPGTVFLITGQQPGLLGGPILWLYKALTCAALAEQWTARLGRTVVPVFWVAGDDSDLAECNYLELLEGWPPAEEGQALALDFAQARKAIPVGSRPIDQDSWSYLLRKLAGAWRGDTMEKAAALVLAEDTLADAFKRLADSWLGPRGMLFLDGNSAALRARTRGVLEGAVWDWRALQSGLERGTEALAAEGFEPQVPLREGVVHAFALLGGERQRLFAEAVPSSELTGTLTDRNSPQGVGFRLYTADSQGRDRLPGLAELTLSHDVFTRPLVAEAALPVLGHVLGPAEMRYFAQMAPVFLERTGSMPLAHPRMSAVVAPAADIAALEKLGIGFAEASTLKPSVLLSRLRRDAWKGHPAAAEIPAEIFADGADGADGIPWLASARATHGRHFQDAGPMERLEKTVRMAWQRYRQTLERMAFKDAQNTQGAGESKYLLHALRWMGNGMGQDRHLNLHSLLDRLGEAGLCELLSAASPAEPGIRLFTWGPGGVMPRSGE